MAIKKYKNCEHLHKVPKATCQEITNHQSIMCNCSECKEITYIQGM